MPETALDPQCERALSKAEIARANGALSKGPISPEGKARSAMNATRHGLSARTMVLGEGEDGSELAALRGALLARWQPVDAAEAHLVEELVFAAWRQVRLRAVEDAVLARAERGEMPSPALPSLATLMRYRGRIERDGRHAVEQLAALRRGRRDLADPMRLRWLAERLEQAQAIAAACAPCSSPSTPCSRPGRPGETPVRPERITVAESDTTATGPAAEKSARGRQLAAGSRLPAAAPVLPAFDRAAFAWARISEAELPLTPEMEALMDETSDEGWRRFVRLRRAQVAAYLTAEAERAAASGRTRRAEATDPAPA